MDDYCTTEERGSDQNRVIVDDVGLGIKIFNFFAGLPYHKNFFYTVPDSDAHFTLKGTLKTMIPRR